MATKITSAAAVHFKAAAAPVATKLLAAINDAAGIDCQLIDGLQAQLAQLYTDSRNQMVGQIQYHSGYGTAGAQ